MNIREYLRRIRIDQQEEPSYSFLKKLHHRHLLSVPFENLDILRGKNIVLNLESIYEKVINRHRGGFCYELNGLFHWLLRELGFSVSMVSAQVCIAEKNSFTPEFDHMALLVHFLPGKTFLADVGFGDSFRKPVELPDGTVEDVSGQYRLKTGDNDQSVIVVERKEEKGYRILYRFTTQPRKLSDFKEMYLFNQTSPDSHFTQQSICTIATQNGRLTLSDDFLTITEGEKKTKIPVSSPEEHREMLKKHFGIKM